MTISEDFQRKSLGHHAVVIGGSIAGLWAARVLGDYFERVTVVERDRFPDSATARKGTPQARHIHILLARGQRIMETLFPGITEELMAAGTPRVELAHDTRMMVMTGRWLQRYHSGRHILTPSRELLEHTLRRRVQAHGRVQFMEGYSAAELLVDAERRKVTGVRVEPSRPGRGAGERMDLDASLVVDASGRTSRTPEWLGRLGYGTVEESVVNSFLGYATRWYKRPEPFGGDWRWMTVQGNPTTNPRGGGVFGVEGERWIVTVSGVMRDYPPTDEAGFEAFVRSVQAPELYEAIRDAEPISPIYGYQRTENRWRRYEKLRRWPERFVVLGDAACSFNPVYGQGMTASAMAAVELARCLRDAQTRGRLDGLARRYQKRLAKVLRIPWIMATGDDFRYAGVEGSQPTALHRLVHWYMDRLIALMPGDRGISDNFGDVVQLIAPPIILLKPSTVWKVLTYRASARADSEGSQQPQAAHS